MMVYPPKSTPSLCSGWFKTVVLCAFAVPLVLSMQAIADETTVSQPSPQEVDFFEKEIRPLLVTHCFECHSGSEAKGGLRLDSRPGIVAGGDSGPAFQSDSPDQSLILKAVRYNDSELQMPPQGALTATQVSMLERWVKLGLPDPRTEPVHADASNKPMGMSIEAGREFWSLKAISNPAIPVVRNPEWVQTPIDNFIGAKLDEAQIQPSQPADRAALIRRASLDLTGLLPSEERIRAFVADDSPAAWENLLDELMSSPQYGVRWGRHWLDVARYADSNGLDENIAYGNAWRYRDYVIDSFNQDKPIDRFMVEQLAGDLLPDSNRETKTATGFLVLGAKVLAEPDREKLVMDTIDEQLDTVGKALMGLTLGCVRCHDHKFDPVKQRDYYALAAIFKSTKTFGDTNFGAIKHWNEISFADATERASLKQINEEIAKQQAALATYKANAFQKLRTEVRAKATEYLMAAVQIDSEMTLQQVAAIAEPLGLHPRVLFHCRRHLSFHPEHPVFSSWHEFVAKKDVQGLEQHYRSLFQQATEAWTSALAKDPKVTKLEDPMLEAARVELNDITGFLAVPPKPEFAFDATTLAEIDRLATAARLHESFAPDETAAMGVADDKIVASIPLHIRGSHRNLGEAVERNFPEVMRAVHEAPILSRKQSGRLEFARWLTSPSHPLTARVYVNRIWGWHFGTGLVASTENFGALGDRPSHPELLDYLARTFIESGWSTKELHKLIMRSSTYRMSAKNSEHHFASQVDPENRLRWRFSMQRMDAEQMRDAILDVAGTLDYQLRGKSIPLRNRQFVFDHTSIDHTRYESHRRATFLPIVRNNVYTFFEQFDFPDPTMPTGHRNQTTVAPQALLLMNSELVINAAKRLAEESAVTPDIDARIERLYRRVLGREPMGQERARAQAFVQSSPSQSTTPTGDGSGPVASGTVGSGTVDPWQLLCQSLLISNEFLFIP
jgi:hypothetical protein